MTFIGTVLFEQCSGDLDDRQCRAHTEGMSQVTERQMIDHVAARLTASYPEIEPAQVGRVVDEEYSRFEGRRIRDYVGLFVERNARVTLAKLGAEERPLQGIAH